MKLRLFFLSVLFISSFSCTKDKPILFVGNFDADLEIPAGLNTVETHYFILRNIPVYFLQNALLSGVDTSKISNISAGRGSINHILGSQDLDFISTVSIYVVSRKNPTVKREMFYLDFVPFATRREIRLLSSTTELKDVLKEDVVDLEVRLLFRSFVPNTLRVKLNLGYTVF
jgi:hypothetical protein